MATAVSPEQALGSLAVGPEQNESKPSGRKKDERKEIATEEARWQPVLNLPCQLTVDLPLSAFHVSDLLKLHAGSVIGTNWQLTRDVPLRINGTLIGWSEFEVVGNRLAVRLTELA
jgi:flagellar motor switch/type III secretory pathway protein FliN